MSKFDIKKKNKYVVASWMASRVAPLMVRGLSHWCVFPTPGWPLATHTLPSGQPRTMAIGPTFHNSHHHYATVGSIAHCRPINATMPPLPRYPTPSLHQPDMPWRIHQAFPHPQSTAPRQPRDYLNPPHPCYHSSPLFLPPPCRAVVACATVYFFKIFEKNYHRFII